MPRFAFACALGMLAFAACSSGSSSTGTTTGSGSPTITIKNYTFSPDPLMVAAGSTVTVINDDVSATATHTASSEAVAGNYDAGIAPNGFFFDTGNIDAGTTATIKIPAGVPSGTKQPYFCKQHTSMMDNPNPTIVIQ